MILRRLIDNLRSQNWTGLSLELLVLVAGVFLGLQVDDWNEGRKDKIDEQLFIERLHSNVLNAEFLSARLVNRRLARRDLAVRAANVLFGRSDTTVLTGEDCIAIVGTEFYNFNAVGLPALDELIASGRMSILENNELRAELVELQQVRAALQTLMIINSEAGFSLASKYTDLIQLAAYMDDEVHSVMTCDADGMRGSQAFLNDFSLNLDRYDGYIRDGVAPWVEQIDRVHALLDDALGINHGAEAGQ